MIEINIFQKAGAFAENKDIARDIRLNEILPGLNNKDEITLNFANVDAATQSFIHALISDVLRIHGRDVLDRIYFKSCTVSVRKVIDIVVDYMQEGIP